MRSIALVLGIVSCFLLAACKGDDDDDGKSNPNRDGGEPAGAAAVDGMINGKTVSCRCSDGDCTVMYDGRNIVSGGKVVIEGVVVSSDGRCQPLP